MSRTVFYGFGGFVGCLTGETTCEWWPDEPATLKWSKSALIPIDLARNPSAMRAGRLKSIADIDVDDHRIDGGLTTIGPRWPSGATIGQIWLSENYYTSLPNKPPRHPASAAGDAYDYELTSILCWDGDHAGRRFIGFHAKIVDTNAPLARVQIWSGGTARTGGRPAGEWWLDLTRAAHPVDPIATQIELGGQLEGALFLDSLTVRSLTLALSKRPPGLGTELLADAT